MRLIGCIFEVEDPQSGERLRATTHRSLEETKTALLAGKQHYGEAMLRLVRRIGPDVKLHTVELLYDDGSRTTRERPMRRTRRPRKRKRVERMRDVEEN